jgi:ATP-dependent DNA helicase PIF1
MELPCANVCPDGPGQFVARVPREHVPIDIETDPRFECEEGDGDTIRVAFKSSDSDLVRRLLTNEGITVTWEGGGGGGVQRSAPSRNDPYERAKYLAQRGASMFITGEGGAGKSYLLWEIVMAFLLQQGKNVVVTAMTGKAADELRRNIPDHVLQAFSEQGEQPPSVTTFHSAFGVPKSVVDGIGCSGHTIEGMSKAWAERIRGNADLMNNWTSAVFIVDEVSMLEGELLDVFGGVGEVLRRPKAQMIFAGDFCQIPPVQPKISVQASPPPGARTRPAVFAFQSIRWSSIIGTRVCELNKNFRVQDPEWQRLLGRVRMGKQTEADKQTLKSMQSGGDREITEEHLRIYPKRDQVDAYNKRRIDELREEGAVPRTYAWRVHKVVKISRGTKQTITANYADFDTAQTLVKRIVASRGSQEGVTLCEGARVMLTTNLDQGLRLVNGACGTVVALDEASVTVEFDQAGQHVIQMQQFSDTNLSPHDRRRRRDQETFEVTVCMMPLEPAFAITIHKIQGTTLDKVYIKLITQSTGTRDGWRSAVFEQGQVYTALSRAKEARNVIVDGIEYCWNMIAPPSAVVNFYQTTFTAAPVDQRRHLGTSRTRTDPYKEKVPMRRTPLAIIFAREAHLDSLKREKERIETNKRLDRQRAQCMEMLRLRQNTTPGQSPATQDPSDLVF